MVTYRALPFCSSFAEVFDLDHFINSLSDEISIVRELPVEYSWSTREYYGTGIRETRIKTAPVHASADWYLENVLPVLQRLVTLQSNSKTKCTLRVKKLTHLDSSTEITQTKLLLITDIYHFVEASLSPSL